MKPSTLIRALAALLLALAANMALAAETLRTAIACEQPTGARPCTPGEIALPYHWDLKYSDSDGSARFEMRFPAASVAPPQAGRGGAAPAVLLPRIGNAFDIELNGNRVFAVGEPGTQRHDTVKRPWLVHLPSAEIRADNALVITIHAALGRAAQLAPPTVGHYAELLPAFERHQFWRVQMTGALMWMAAVLSVMSLAVWTVQREGVFLAYAVAELAWACRLSEMFMIEMPLDWQLWGAGVVLAFATAQLAMAWFFLNVVDRWRGRIRTGYYAYVGLWLLVAPIAIGLKLRDLWVGWVLLGAAIFLVLAVYIGWRGFKDRHVWRWLFGSFLLAAVVAGVLDILESPGSMYMHPTWTRLVWGGYSVVLALLVGRRLHKSRAALLASNAGMREALERQARELREAHEHQARADLGNAMLAERQRVMRDMHDGIGAHLSSMFSLVSREPPPRDELQGELKAAMEELRMVVDAMTPFDGNLAVMLGSLRPRLERRLGLAQISLEWAVDELPVAEHLTPTQIQHLQRLLLEAATNVAKHSQATVAVLSARGAPEGIELEMRDNGKGFASDARYAGNGLRNMHWRAAALGATLSISGEGGSTLVLRLPV